MDGAPSNEAGELGPEMRQALLAARSSGGPKAMTARQTLELATIHSARCLVREGEIGSLEPGNLAGVALWRIDDFGHASIEEPVAALVLRSSRRVELLLVNGRTVVKGGELRTADEAEISIGIAAASQRLAGKAEEVAL